MNYLSWEQTSTSGAVLKQVHIPLPDKVHQQQADLVMALMTNLPRSPRCHSVHVFERPDQPGDILVPQDQALDTLLRLSRCVSQYSLALSDYDDLSRGLGLGPGADREPSVSNVLDLEDEYLTVHNWLTKSSSDAPLSTWFRERPNWVSYTQGYYWLDTEHTDYESLVLVRVVDEHTIVCYDGASNEGRGNRPITIDTSTYPWTGPDRIYPMIRTDHPKFEAIWNLERLDDQVNDLLWRLSDSGEALSHLYNYTPFQRSLETTRKYLDNLIRIAKDW